MYLINILYVCINTTWSTSLQSSNHHHSPCRWILVENYTNLSLSFSSTLSLSLLNIMEHLKEPSCEIFTHYFTERRVHHARCQRRASVSISCRALCRKNSRRSAFEDQRVRLIPKLGSVVLDSSCWCRWHGEFELRPFRPRTAHLMSPKAIKCVQRMHRRKRL